MDYIIVELFGSNIDSLNERILTHLQMRKSSLRKIREVIREYAENLGICQNSVFFSKIGPVSRNPDCFKSEIFNRPSVRVSAKLKIG